MRAIALVGFALLLIPFASAAGGGFDSGTLAAGATFSFTFTDPGTFVYHCNIHSNMKGKIIVTSDAGSGSHPIDIKNSAFPDQFTVAKGTVVTWTNRDGYAHTVTSDTQGNTAGTTTPAVGVTAALAGLAVLALLLARRR